MRDVAAIVQPDPARAAERELQADIIKLNDSERKESADAARAEGSRAEAAARRLDVGRKLVERQNSGEYGHGEWIPFLTRIGIERTRAAHLMKQYRELQCDQLSNRSHCVPDNENDPECPDEEQSGQDQPAANSIKSFHILIDSGRLKDAVRKRAMKWPDDARKSIPALLRDLADDLEIEFC